MNKKHCCKLKHFFDNFLTLAVGAVVSLGTASILRADSDSNTGQNHITGTIITAGSRVGGQTRYSRVIRLAHGTANGTLLATYESSTVLHFFKSTDDGLTWTDIASPTLSSGAGWSARVEPDLFELPSAAGSLAAGTILLAANAQNGSANRMELWYSTNNGVTWSYRGVADSNSTGHLWEPRLLMGSSGQLVYIYSDSSHSGSGYNQLLGERVSTDGGLTWGSEIYVCAINDGVQRPGMAVTTQMPNGQYVISFEANGDGTSGGHVHIKFSTDGVNWGSSPSDYGTQIYTGSGAYLGGCPFITWTPAGGAKGSLVVSAKNLVNTPRSDRQFLINTNYGVGDWTMIPCPVQWNGGNSLAGWSSGMIPTADGLGVIQLASSATIADPTQNQMSYAREQLMFSGTPYTLVNKNSGLALDIPGSSIVPGTGLDQNILNGAPNQNWIFNYVGDNVWTVANPGNGLVWDDLNGNTNLNAVVDENTSTGLAVQQWKLRTVGDGSWKFVNVNSGNIMAVNGGSTSAGAAITQDSDNGTTDQYWNFQQPGVVTNGTYKLVSLNSGLVADVKGLGTTNGARVQQYTYNAGANQKWAVTNLGNGYVKIIGVQSGRALEVVGSGTANGTSIDIWSYSGAANQQWLPTVTSGGNYRLTPAHATGSALDVKGAGLTNGTPLQIYSWNGGNNQQWSFQAP